MKQLTAKHEFALYWQETTAQITRPGMLVETNNQLLMHRIVQVLRLEHGDQCILFDRSHHARVTIEKITKKNITLQVDILNSNTTIQPSITFLLPLLKRESLETALYSLVELGASNIQLVITDKIQRKWAGASELERLEKIMIAAAEQSKNFSFAQLHEPITLMNAIKIYGKPGQPCIYADPDGMPLIELVEKLPDEKNNGFVLMVGPEGDLQESEKELLRQHEFLFCQLTPTILRACQAAGLLLGVMRSIVR